jgi:hypothetical protein
MENSYFIYSKDNSCVEIVRFHSYIWEFNHNYLTTEKVTIETSI